MVFASAQGFDHGFGRCFDVSRYSVGDFTDTNHAWADAVPCVCAFPCAIDNSLGARDVVGCPIVDDGRNAWEWTELCHVGCLAECDNIACGLRCGLWCGRIGVLQDYVSALFDQNGGSFGFFCWIEPSVGPNDFELDVRVNFARMQECRVDATDNFRDREGRNVAHNVAFGHVTGNVSLDRAAFIEACGICGYVIGTLVTSCVLELHIREIGSDVDCLIHITKGSCKDQVGTLQRHLCHHALCVGTFRDAFDVDGFNRVAECFFDGQTAFVVLVSPAAVADWANVDKAYFGLMRIGKSAGRKTKCKCCTGQNGFDFHVFPLGGLVGDAFNVRHGMIGPVIRALVQPA